MPIDDALEKIEGQGGPKPPTGETAKAPSGLEERAREVIGKFLVEFYSGRIAGQRPGVAPLEKVISQAVEKVGFYMLAITPRKDSEQRRIISSRLDDNASPEVFKELLRLMCGEYALETDLMALVSPQSNRAELIPEYQQITERLVKLGPEIGFSLATLHPYLFVMGMNLEQRPLATLAVEKAFNQKRIKLLTGVLEEYLSITSIKAYISTMLPSTADYVSVAQEYGIKEVVPVLREMQRVVDSYLKWGNS